MTLVKTGLDELTYKVNGLAMEVQRELRAGHREGVYQRRLAELVREAGFQVEAEKQVEVYVNDSLVGYMYLDLWIEQALVVECKAFSHELTKDEVGQVVTYLAATGSPVGMLYNFGRQKLEFKRILPPKNVQDWHKHLYRCIWTPQGVSLPPIDSITSETPIRFSVVSQPSGNIESSVSIRLSASHPLETPSASRSNPLSTSYASSGVNIDSGNRAVELMREAVQSTYGPEVLAGIGAFGGLFDASALKQMEQPVLVASTDGVGTKVKLAAQAGRYASIGYDIVNHCINDILVQGARPLFFLDYCASSKLQPEVVAEIVGGIAAACREAGCALLGGETAEMPGVYEAGEFDVAGTIVGLVDRARLLPRSDLRPGDVLLGLASSGPHTNGYSLIRKIFEGVPLDTIFPELGAPLADVLLMPHRSYLPFLQSSISNPQSSIKALAHLTGGGFLENIPRILPEGLGAVVRLESWPIPPLFQFIQQRGEVEMEEMYRVFNMGIGMIVIVSPAEAHALQSALGEETCVIGELVNGERKVWLQ
jgi:phosphoribosylformylglycinamidine cyclo-ligase